MFSQPWQQRGGAKGGALWTVSPMTPGRRIASPFHPSVGRRLTIGRHRGQMGAKQPRWPFLPRREARGGFSRPFPPFRNYFRFCNALYFLIIHDFNTFWTLPGTFQVLPVPEFYFRSNTRDQKWNANKSVSLAPATISLQCRLGASSRQFAPIVSKMAAKTVSGSGFDHKFGLSAPGFLIRNAFLGVYLQE